MTRLWIIRHAQALPGSDDFSRELSPHGRAQAEALGRFLRNQNIAPPDLLWHSPLVRARQTTETLLKSAAWSPKIESNDNLTPDDDPAQIVTEIENQISPTSSLALIGHNPHLTRLASLLILGDSEAEAFQMETATCLCLENRPHFTGTRGQFRRWSVAWMLPPQIIPAQSS